MGHVLEGGLWRGGVGHTGMGMSSRHGVYHVGVGGLFRGE